MSARKSKSWQQCIADAHNNGPSVIRPGLEWGCGKIRWRVTRCLPGGVVECKSTTGLKLLTTSTRTIRTALAQTGGVR